MAFKRKWENPTNTPTYNSWRSMRFRILSGYPIYEKSYKDKGIEICPEWVDNYDAFYRDMGERPFNTTLDRVDNSKGYSPNNCRWASNKLQQNNKDSCAFVEYKGVVKTISEWAFELELTPTELSRAYKRFSTYGAKTYEEIFCKHLMSYRYAQKTHICTFCKTTESIKWRKELCNTCYARVLRWSKKQGLNKIDICGYAALAGEMIDD